jgi:hypothetical protein
LINAQQDLRGGRQDYYPEVGQCSEILQRRHGPKKMAQCGYFGTNPHLAELLRSQTSVDECIGL